MVTRDLLIQCTVLIDCSSQCSKKQAYTSLESLRAVHVVKKIDNKYMLTAIGFEILQQIAKIIEIEPNQLSYRLKEIVRTDPQLTPDEKESIFMNVKL